MRFRRQYMIALGIGTALVALNFGSAANVHAATDTNTFNVTATVAASCSVTANDLAFGSYTSTGGDLDATTTIDVTCTNGTSYEVGLDGGTTNNDITRRQMAGSGNKLTYWLYTDSGRSNNWTDIGGGNTVSDTGNGSVQTITIYGRIPGSQSIAPDSYSDTVTATVSF